MPIPIVPWASQSGTDCNSLLFPLCKSKHLPQLRLPASKANPLFFIAVLFIQTWNLFLLERSLHSRKNWYTYAQFWFSHSHNENLDISGSDNLYICWIAPTNSLYVPFFSVIFFREYNKMSRPFNGLSDPQYFLSPVGSHLRWLTNVIPIYILPTSNKRWEIKHYIVYSRLESASPSFSKSRCFSILFIRQLSAPIKILFFKYIFK